MNELATRLAQLRDKALLVLEARRAGNLEQAATMQHELDVLQTELEVQQDELLDSQRRSSELAAYYRQLFFESPVALVLLDNAFAVREFNRRAESLLGLPADRCVGLNFVQFVASEDQDRWQRLISCAEDEPARVELVLRRNGGARRKCFASLARRADGPMLMLEDLTALRHAEDERRVVDERLARLLQDSHDGVLFFDAHTFLVTQVNGSFARMLGRPADHLVGRSVLSLFPEDVAAHQELALKQAAGAGSSSTLELRFSAGAAVIDSEVTVGRLREGTTLLVSLLVRDVSVRRGLEVERAQLLKERAQSQKLEAIGQLATGLAHNLNNVLAAILGCATAHPDGSREELGEAMEDIRVATLRGREITAQLSALARSEPARPAPFDLVATLDEVSKLLRRTLPNDVELVLGLPEGPVLFHGDAADWHQVFLNLAINARDAMPRGGTLRFEGKLEGDEVIITVRDTGEGMSREVLDHAFEPFFTTKPPGKGTGLGLSHVAAVARVHGVRIWCESSPGRGTAMTLRFKRLRSPVALEPRPAQAPPATVRLSGRVLLVDDDAMVRRSTVRVLKRLGVEVLEAASGHEGLHLAEREKVDVVLTDLTMPHMSGLELAANLHGRLPVVLVTGHLHALSEAKEFISAVVSKPFKPEELHEVLARLLPAP